MARLIPNENTYLGFVLTIADIHAPKLSEITAGVDLTHFLMSVNASTTGNTVPTPSLDTLFETSIAGTVTGSFTCDFYRDDDDDLAWDTLPRKTFGYVVLSRFGGTGVTGHPTQPVVADVAEIWPILVVSRTNSNNTNNAVLTFTMTASIPIEPVEDATIAT